MSFRKSRIHYTGLSNADRSTMSLSPIKPRIPLHEPKQSSYYKQTNNSPESPISTTVQKYKTWNKKMKSDFAEQPSIEPKLSLKPDPPDYANHKKPEKKYKTEDNYFSPPVIDQFSNFLTTNNVNLKAKFVQLDKSKKNGINSQEFFELLDSVHAPPSLIKNSLSLFKELGGEQVLKYSQVIPLMNKKKETPDYPVKVVSSQDELIDKQKAAPNQLELIFNRGNRLRQMLKSKFLSKQGLLDELKAHSNNNRIQIQDLKAFLLSKLDTEVPASELKGLLNAYDYNKDKQTDTEEVAKYIFMDNNSANDYLHLKKRAIAPTRAPDQQPSASPSKLKPLLLQIEQKMFTQGTNRFLPVFKAFDKDNDGYLTVEDLDQGLSANQIPHSSEDVKNLFSFLDENSNGFVTFQEFSRKIQPNIITVNRNSLQESELAHINLSQPSTFFLEMQKSRLPPLLSNVSEYSARVTSRYSSSPPYKDTFPSFAPGRESPMFLNDDLRYYGKRFEPVNFGHEDKMRMRNNLEAKIGVIQKMKEAQEKRVQDFDQKIVALDEGNVRVKKGVRIEYERKCKSGLMD